jgi:hypothetical protein
VYISGVNEDNLLNDPKDQAEHDNTSSSFPSFPSLSSSSSSSSSAPYSDNPIFLLLHLNLYAFQGNTHDQNEFTSIIKKSIDNPNVKIILIHDVSLIISL